MIPIRFRISAPRVHSPLVLKCVRLALNQESVERYHDGDPLFEVYIMTDNGNTTFDVYLVSDLDKVKAWFDADGLDGFGHDSDSEVIDEGDWIDDGKYSFISSVVRYKDKFYQIDQSRSGSYHTDYYYNDPEIFEVSRSEKVVVQVVWTKV